MLWSYHKCAAAINCFCDLSSLFTLQEIVPQSVSLKKLLVKPVLFYGQTKKHLFTFIFSTKLFKNMFSCKNIG